MLVKFRSDVGGFTMFGDIATQLLKMMGHSGSVPSAILAEDIPDAFQRLEAALAAAGNAPAEDDSENTEQREQPVSLGQRAYPLLELLRHAAQQNCAVMWDKE